MKQLSQDYEKFPHPFLNTFGNWYVNLHVLGIGLLIFLCFYMLAIFMSNEAQMFVNILHRDWSPTPRVTRRRGSAIPRPRPCCFTQPLLPARISALLFRHEHEKLAYRRI